MAKKIETLGTAHILEDIADALREMDKLTQDELDQAVKIYKSIDEVFFTEPSVTKFDTIVSLRKQLPKDFEYNYSLLIDAMKMIPGAHKTIVEFLDFS